MDELSIRPFDFSDTDYASWKAVHDAAYPDEPLSLEQLRYGFATWNKTRLLYPVVLEQGGEVVAVGDWREPGWAHRPGKYNLPITIRPNFNPSPILQAFYDAAWAALQPRTPAPRELIAITRENKRAICDFWEANGFVETARSLISELHVSEFDEAAFAWTDAKLIEHGLTIYTVSQLQQHDPDSWQEKLYHAVWLEGMVDVPSNDPWTPPGLEQFIKEDIETPHFDPDAYFVAVDAAGDYVSITSFRVDKSKPHHLGTDMTATVRAYRRKGVAIAVKVHAIRWAKAHGAVTIETENHAANPMYALNVKLGFRPKPAWIRYQKDL